MHVAMLDLPRFLPQLLRRNRGRIKEESGGFIKLSPLYKCACELRTVVTL